MLQELDHICIKASDRQNSFNTTILESRKGTVDEKKKDDYSFEWEPALIRDAIQNGLRNRFKKDGFG